MIRKFLVTIILVVSLKAQIEKFQFVANKVDTKNNIMIATGNVVVFSPTYYITAQKIIYDKNKGTFELFDDVLILKDNNVQTKSDYAFLDINSDDLYQKPSLLFEDKTSIWISSKDSNKKDDVTTLAKSIFSSCDCVDPDWSIRMSSADYDTNDQWINSYNTRLYIKDVPVLYTPYLGFSTNTNRRTGLLVPVLGQSKSEGFSYSQPIFIASKKNYDLELIPQYRTKRGGGMYAYVRYADSIDSMLKISGGYFNEQSEYKEENNLRNSKHYGLDIDYERYNLFTKNTDAKDGLYVSINYLNDIEYRTLEDEKYSQSTERKVESKINYFYDTPKYFLGSYFRYYIDTQTDSNSATMQELPKLQAHIYSQPFILDNLLYSADIKYTNHYREDGINANQYEVNLPLSYSFSFFDDYLKLVLKHEFILNKYEYSNTANIYEDATYGESNTTISLNTDLIKPYENYLHTMNLRSDYIHSDSFKEDGDLYSISNNNSELSPFPFTKSSNSIILGINQSLYDNEDLKQIVNHKLSQSILYDEFDNIKFQNMENEILYNYILGSVKNKLVYNHQDEKLVESSSSFSLTYDNFNMKLGHYMSKKTDNSGKDELESYQIEAKYKLSDEYSVGYSTSYNILEELRSKQSFIFSITDKCWNLDLKYEKEITASSTTDGNPIKQDIIYLELLLKPLGGINYDYEVKKTSSIN
jgi:LPS-assembly protein